MSNKDLKNIYFMSNMKVMKLLGFNDFFLAGSPASKEEYALQVGKNDIQRLCCLMLTYCKEGHTPSVEEILIMWFEYKDKSHADSPSFHMLHDNYRKLIYYTGHNQYYFLSEESLLNLYIWSTQHPDLPERIEHVNGSFMIQLFMLYLLFNNDVLSNFDKAEESANRDKEQINMRRILAERFPQNDLVDIDYGKLVFTQTVKLMELLNFLERTPKYQALYQHSLADFGCSSKEQYFKALGGAVIIPLNPLKTGINSLILDDSSDTEQAEEFLNKLAFDPGDVSLGPTDYKFLRDRPLQKTTNEYRVVFDLFLIKKFYNGYIFKLSGYVNQQPLLFKGPFFGAIRDDFSEGVLLYNTLDVILVRDEIINIKGNDFKKNGVEREPDYYSRYQDKVILFESKDFFMVAADKLSYDFDQIVGGLKVEGRFGKAVLQSATNVGRVLQQSLKLDGGYDSNSIQIFPVVVVHDSLYNTPALNYWVNQWFQEKLSAKLTEKEFEGIEFKPVMPLTLIDIDSLILYRTNFEKGELDLFELLQNYQEYVNFDAVEDKMDEKFGRALVPFSSFIKSVLDKNDFKVDLSLIGETYRASGYQD